MTADYRSRPKGPRDDVVRYRPLGKLLPVGIVGVLIAVALFSSLVGCNDATPTVVTCGRTAEGGSCIITRTWPILGESSNIVPLSSITGTDVRAHSSKKGNTYSVVLVTGAGDVSLSERVTSDRGAREAFRQELYGFLTDPTRPSIKLQYDQGSSAPLLSSLTLLVPLLAAWATLQRVTLTFGWEDRRLRLRRTRWPLAAWTRSYRFDEVVRARLVAKPGSKNSVNYSVVLDLVGGESEPLSRASSNKAAHHEATVDEINALLARRETATLRD